MPGLADKNLCTGCGGCKSACPRGCIDMVADGEGFLYPTVDGALCVECGRCSSVCPVLGDAPVINEPVAYAAHNLDAGLVSTSSSGGVFTELAKSVIARGGAVYGAAFRDDLSVGHTRVDTVDGLFAFRGSKYLQSDIGNTFCDVKRDVEAGTPVLFSGTPCQAAALRTFLNKDYDNLLVTDIICHSVPSPKVWKRYLERTPNAVSANFRDKRDGWQGYYLSIKQSDGGEYVKRGADSAYMKAFLNGLSTRPSCYSCKFKGHDRGSDITLADFWGVETAYPEAYHKEGTSLVLVNSEKGQSAFAAVTGNIMAMHVDTVAALAQNNAYYKPALAHPRRGEFFARFESEDFDVLTERLLAPTKSELLQRVWHRSIPYRALRKLYRMIRS